MSQIVIDHDDVAHTYHVIGVVKDGEFRISGPWDSMEIAEAHAKQVIGLFEEAAAEIVAQSKRRIVLA